MNYYQKSNIFSEFRKFEFPKHFGLKKVSSKEIDQRGNWCCGTWQVILIVILNFCGYFYQVYLNHKWVWEGWRVCHLTSNFSKSELMLGLLFLFTWQKVYCFSTHHPWNLSKQKYIYSLWIMASWISKSKTYFKIFSDKFDTNLENVCFCHL